MAQSVRQRNLFAAEDFTVVYDTFKQANFQAYDYDTIRQTMVDYIRNNYPENFNDWIQSSEFVALIELLAFLGHNLAFRVDLAGRENFLSTAERRASVLRIADFLGYNPVRALPARGMLKIQTIKTNQNIYDINGSSLKNKVINFVDEQDTTSYQNFLLVMNEVLGSSNRFGRPVSKATINNVKHEVYRINQAAGQDIVYKFKARVNGTEQTFEIHGTSIVDSVVQENIPNPETAFTLIYKNDNQGITSPDTGFFVGFKQGTLQFSDYNADSAVSNLHLSVNSSSINNIDVWVQTVDTLGTVITDWTKIDSTYGSSAIFNALSNDIRTVYSVKTLENDAISVNFGDGVFADIPRGILRVWYRNSLNETYTLNPDDVGTVNFSIKYVGSDNNEYTVAFSAELEYSVNNASSRETVSSIKENAGRVFATQDRMVTAEDYSILPLTVSNNVKKIKSVNRTHAGHSRFIRLNDPTAHYQNVTMVADDGYIYGEDILERTSIALPTDMTSSQIFDFYIAELIQNPELFNLYYQKYNPFNVPYEPGIVDNTTAFQWQLVSADTNGCTGYITRAGIPERVGESITNAMEDVKVGSIVEFTESPWIDGSLGNSGEVFDIVSGGYGYTTANVFIYGTGTGATATATIVDGAVTRVTITNGGTGYSNPVVVTIVGDGTGAVARATAKSSRKLWARVVSIDNEGLGVDNITGVPTGIDSRGQGAVILSNSVPQNARISRVFPTLKTQFSADEQLAIINAINLNNSFGIRYDAVNSLWKIVSANDLPQSSYNNPRYFSLANAGISDGATPDQSWVIRVNKQIDRWEILSRRYRIVYGSSESVRFYNQNGNVRFNTETNKPERDEINVMGINFKPNGSPNSLGNDIKFYGYRYYAEPSGYTDDHKLLVTVSSVTNDMYPENPMSYRELVGPDQIGLASVTEDGFDYQVYSPASEPAISGRAGLTFKWKRVAETGVRIDPSISNIIDTFVLTSSYDLEFREWIANNRRITDMPKPPTTEQLKAQFTGLDNKKSVSDTVVYRTAKYKVLFGELADTSLQAKFRVVKVKGTTLSDNEIKSRVLDAINEFFNVTNWDFGETFYFTELAAYVHNQLLGIISSIVIVPTQENSAFGNLFQVTPGSDELFIPDVDLTRIELVTNFTSSNLRAGSAV